MKKILLIILLFPLGVFAQFYSGTITFNDGTNKSGLIKLPKYKDSKLNFKSEKKAKTEKFSIENIKGFEITNDDDELENYIPMRVGNNKILNPKKFNIDKKKSFVKIIKQGKISVYAIRYISSTSSGRANGGINVVNNVADAYYLQRENDDFAFSIGTHRHDLNFLVGINFYVAIEFNFAEICPNFVNLLKEADLSVKEFSKIVDIYEENCN